MKAGHLGLGIVLTMVALSAIAANTPKIIGGDPAPSGAWPWMAGLMSADSESAYRGLFCGGTLIDDDWVVTAGHCVFRTSPEEIDVVIGVDNLKWDLSDGIGERISAKRIVINPNYNDGLLYNDIALIQIERPVAYASASVDNGQTDLSGELGTILGWGDTNPRWPQDLPSVLMQTEVPIVSNATCVRTYGDTEITPDMLCAGFAAGGYDTCQGDSGGPLLIYGSGDWTLAGITSWGDGCARPGEYGVYTRVASYGSFIDEVITTDYFACADANSDGIVNDADITAYRRNRLSEFRDWMNNCWSPKASCGDVNEDGVVNSTDRRLKVADLRTEARDWFSVCWEPEMQ